MKKKAQDTLATWLISFLVIVFIMLIYLGFALVGYGEKSFLDNKVRVKNDVSSLQQKELLSFLNQEIEVKREKVRIIEGIRNSLDRFFSIKNENGENFIEVFSIKGLNEREDNLYDKMLARGFDDNDWNEFIEAKREVQEGELVEKIILELNKICNVERWDAYFLELPYGIVTNDGLKLKETIGEDIFLDNDPTLYTPSLNFKFNYKGENIELKFRKFIGCDV
ncbi:hypothetical protein J4221_03765 [Candidatus Pacearchaeota archaeon]|nr:hypothetical protein [Candidatus Pacearchaeota archaeon]